MTVKIAFIDSVNAFGSNMNVFPNENIIIRQVPQYEIKSYDFSEINVIMIPNFSDQENLYMHKDVIETFLNERKIVVFFGHLFRQWLPETPLFMPEKITHFTDYNLYQQNNTSIFKDVKTEDMTFNKGVAGFFARGHYIVDSSCEVHLSFGNGHTVSYADRTTTAGTIFVHGGRSLLDYYEQGKSTDVLRAQFIDWLITETEFLQGESE